MYDIYIYIYTHTYSYAYIYIYVYTLTFIVPHSYIFPVSRILLVPALAGGYLLVFAEELKPDLGGKFWALQPLVL